jgi:GR25 family glycosyltransferase involved in LPS biosynthesis
VCVVLEDDAVLVEGFIDRLTALLEELPRDFHFCYIGYSRPMTAPLVKYSSLLGIPTCLWYLTGYIMSLEGANYLLQSLPVAGPIDSWMGLKICHTNWDNVFGETIGMGRHSKFHIDTPLARKDLVTILKFRTFAALVPLCNQKIGSASSSSAPSRLSWRDRDTDITYSGNS